MIKSFRVAAVAAASALLCPAFAFAGERTPAPMATVTETAAAPATSVATAASRWVLATSAAAPGAAATVAATPAAAIASAATPVRPFGGLFGVIPAAPAPTVQPATMSSTTALTPGRFRPDRTGVTGFASTPAAPTAPAAPNLGVSGMMMAQSVDGRPLADLVNAHMSTASGDEQFDCLARTVYFESRGEPLEGQLAVAEVVLNRVRSGRFRSTICDVVTQRAQFSFVRGGVIPEVPRQSAAWQRSVAIARIATDRLARVTGDESLFFHATYVHPTWGRPLIARIGNHIFYR